jgi:hypothetical protein
VRYQATSLNDIALQFQRRAQAEYSAAEKATFRSAKQVYEARAATWEAAASILSKTDLIP